MDEILEGQPVAAPEGVNYETCEILGVPIFRAGKYAPQGEWTADEVDKIARAYDATWEEAPVTLDHAQEGPALGWVKRLYRVGDELLADFAMTWPGFMAWEGKFFKRRSVELFRKFDMPDGSTAPYLRAVSLLGASSPAVKGMRNVFASAVTTGDSRLFSFSTAADDGGADGVLSIQFADDFREGQTVPPTHNEPTTTRSDDMIPRNAPATPENNETPTAPVQNFTEEVAAFRQRAEQAEADAVQIREQFSAAVARIETLETAATVAERETRLRGFNDKARVAVEEGRMTPAQVDSLREIFSALETGAGTPSGATAPDAICAFMATSPALVPLGPSESGAGSPPTPKADPDDPKLWSDAVAARADALCKADPNLDIIEATISAERQMLNAASN